jgi:hypothetical protein
MGRATQGVTLINLDADEKLAGLERVAETEESVAAEVLLDPDAVVQPDNDEPSLLAGEDTDTELPDEGEDQSGGDDPDVPPTDQ